MILPKSDKIVVSVSGGADSAILYYDLCATIREHGLRVSIKPITMDSWGRPYHHIFAQNVIDFVQEAFPEIDHHEHGSYYVDDRQDAPGTIFISISSRFLMEVYRELGIAGYSEIYSGVTLNPKPTDCDWSDDPVWNLRDPGRDRVRTPMYTTDYNSVIYRPYAHIDKRGIRDLYVKYGVLDSLFPMTWSCQGTRTECRQYTAHCGKCWWCLERQWGFGRLI